VTFIRFSGQKEKGLDLPRGCGSGTINEKLHIAYYKVHAVILLPKIARVLQFFPPNLIMDTRSDDFKLPPLPPQPKKPKLSSLLQYTLVKILVLRKILLLTDGRDKLMKVMQYGSKILLWKVFIAETTPKQRLGSLANQLSTTRKLIRLGHCLEPFADSIQILKDKNFNTTDQKLAPLNAALSFTNDIVDDMICLAKIGVIDKSWGSKLTPLSDRLWYSTIFIDVHANLSATRELVQKRDAERSTELKLQISHKIDMQYVSLVKLLADFVFCSVDVFELQVSPGVQHLSGFLAAILGTFKLYVKNK
jgi:hypothetical protein